MKMFEAGNRIRILGEARHNLFAFEMIHPQCKLIRDSDVLPQSLTPIYSLVASNGAILDWVCAGSGKSDFPQ